MHFNLETAYLWGAMGSAALTGLGLAQAQPAKRIMVITGDGEQLMAFGSLATIAVAQPKNLDIIVLDNQHFGETGMQDSHTGMGIDISKNAAACGFAQTGVLTDLQQVDELCNTLRRPSNGPPTLCAENRGAEPAPLITTARPDLHQK